MAVARRRVLVIEDDPKAADIVRLYLERDGHDVMISHDGAQGLELARDMAPDLVVLDLLLPGLSGLDVCRALSDESDVPIIMLTALGTEGDKLRCLDLGADDYVTKPFSPRELAARVRAVLRRTGEAPALRGPQEMELGEIKIDFDKRQVRVGRSDVHLTPTEFRIFTALAREPGRVFSRSQLVDRAMGYDFDGMERTVDVHVLNLRRKIEEDYNRPEYIKTVYGIGYKFGG